MATDATLRKQFAGDATAVLRTLTERGLELTSVEIEALAAIEPDALSSFASSLDRRLCRAMTETTNHREEL